MTIYVHFGFAQKIESYCIKSLEDSSRQRYAFITEYLCKAPAGFTALPIKSVAYPDCSGANSGLPQHIVYGSDFIGKAQPSGFAS